MAKKLLDAGHDVHVLLRGSSSSKMELENLPVQVRLGDITREDSLLDAFREMDSVFHLAGHVGYSRAERQLMELVNVQGTANVVEACIKTNVRRLVHMSSVVAVGAAFYGEKPLNEDSPYTIGHLDLGYFETKRKAEMLVKEASASGRLDAVILNPSTIYGAGDARKGSRKTQLKVARGQLPFYTSGGVSIVAVEDVVEATYTAWQRGKNGERYILSGENLLIKDLFQMIAEEADVKPPPIYLPNPVVMGLGRIGDWLESIGKKGPLNSENAWTATLFHWFDSTKAQKELGLRPRPARECIAASVRWSKENGLI